MTNIDDLSEIEILELFRLWTDIDILRLPYLVVTPSLVSQFIYWLQVSPDSMRSVAAPVQEACMQLVCEFRRQTAELIS
jgi:hypothetical protein